MSMGLCPTHARRAREPRYYKTKRLKDKGQVPHIKLMHSLQAKPPFPRLQGII